MASASGAARTEFAEAETVFLVEDDELLARALELVLESHGLRVVHYGSAEGFLAEAATAERCCLVLDVRLPKMNGLALQQALLERGDILPIVFITAHGDVSMSVRALKSGAVDFLEKPFSEQTLLRAVRQALARERCLRREQAEDRQARAVRVRLEKLTDREREVFALVVADLSSKEVAARLGVSPRTVEHHRAHIMEKLAARSFHDLLLMAVLCGLCEPHEMLRT